ncbi:MAG: methyl-accepting chemotaxis protein [Pseudomonadales bacterium]
MRPTFLVTAGAVLTTLASVIAMACWLLTSGATIIERLDNEIDSRQVQTLEQIRGLHLTIDKEQSIQRLILLIITFACILASGLLTVSLARTRTQAANTLSDSETSNTAEALIQEHLTASLQRLSKHAGIVASHMKISAKDEEKKHIQIRRLNLALAGLEVIGGKLIGQADIAAEAARAADLQARMGEELARKAVGQIEKVSEEVGKSSEFTDDLKSESQKISSVLEVISSIADQTNLLALNAAIEAARAGESGRGFAVVADEVRSLAQRTRDATVEIQKMISHLQQIANGAAGMMVLCRDITTASLVDAYKAGESVVAVTAMIDGLVRINTTIVSLTQEELEATREVLTCMDAVAKHEPSDPSSQVLVFEISAELEQLQQVLRRTISVTDTCEGDPISAYRKPTSIDCKK